MATPKATSAEKKPAAPKKAPAKPATAKLAAKASTAKPAVAKKPAAKKPAAAKPKKVGAEERYRMVEVAAYFLAERNNFKGSPVEYWTAAEAQIDIMLSK